MDRPHTGSTHLLVDLDGLLVLLQLSTVSSHLQQTLVGRTKETTTHLVNYKSYIFGAVITIIQQFSSLECETKK